MNPFLGHDIAQRHAPHAVIVTCSCGWSHVETRRQNAFARASKVRAAVSRHKEAVAVAEVRAARRRLAAEVPS